MGCKRFAVILVCSVLVCSVLLCGAAFGLGAWQSNGSAALPALADLRAIYASHDWFKLREAIAGKEVPPLYRGAVAAAFSQAGEAEEALLPLINGSVTSKDADDANDWLSYLFVRAGQYQKAAAEMDEGTPLLAMLRTLPDQSVTLFAASSVPARLSQQRLFVPAVIDGKQVEFFLDSDANFSFMSESEAKSLGLMIRESDLKVHGAGGIQSSFRTAVADELSVGNIHLAHVAFIVMADREEAFARLPAHQQGALGLPVLLAFRTLRYSKAGLDLGQPSGLKADAAQQNLCFDGLDPVTRIRFDRQQLPAILDTGAAHTELWPPFARQFAGLVNSGRSRSTFENSFGGKSSVPDKLLAEIVLALGGCDIPIRPARVLLASTTPNSQRYYGRIGLDALTSAHEFTIDFEALRLAAK